jgi:hypothetical protein
MWGFDIRGYHDYGSITLDIQDTDGAKQLLLDWYPLVRDMGKRALKYKHLPTTLATAPDMLRYWCNAYFVVVANLTTLLNLNRLSMVNAGLASLSSMLPRYMSRINRLWRRTSALAAPGFLKAHAIKSGMIVSVPNFCAPIIRLWSFDTMLATASGGPTRTSMTDEVFNLLRNDSTLGAFVAQLETTERWLEVGHATVAIDDFIAMKDLIDMTHDIVPGSFVTGLPEASSMPGVVADKRLLVDFLTRVLSWKDDQTTDQWGIFPIPAETVFGGRVPIIGYGVPDIYDHTFLGAAKYGHFNSLTSRDAAVDTAFRYLGTDIPSSSAGLSAVATAFNTRNSFGVATYDEVVLRDGDPGTSINLGTFIDWDSAVGIRTFLLADSLKTKHLWARLMPAIRSAWTTNVWSRAIDEAAFDYIFWLDAEDLGQNYATFVAQQLGIPFLK